MLPEAIAYRPVSLADFAGDPGFTERELQSFIDWFDEQWDGEAVRDAIWGKG